MPDNPKTKPYEVITMSELHRHAGDVIARVFYGRVPVLVLARGQPRAFIFPALVVEDDEEGALTTLVPTTINIHRPADD